MTNKYLEKVAKAKPAERIEPTMKATVGDTVNRTVGKVARNVKGKGAIVAGAVAGGAALGALATKAMTKKAGITSAVKSFVGHATGKTLQKAEIHHAVAEGMHRAGDIEVKSYRDYAEASKHLNSDAASKQFGSHMDRLKGQHDANAGVIRALDNHGHGIPGNAGDENILKTLRAKKKAAQITTGVGAAGVVGGAFAAGKKSSKK